MLRSVSICTLAIASILLCSGCGSSSRTAEQKSKAPTNEVAAAKPAEAKEAPKPVAQETPALGVSKPYTIGEPKGGCKMIVIYDKDGSVRNVAACDSDRNGNVLSITPLKVSANRTAELFLQP